MRLSHISTYGLMTVLSLGCAGASPMTEPPADLLDEGQTVSETTGSRASTAPKQSPRRQASIPVVSGCELPVATRIPLSSMRTYPEYARMGGIPLGLDVFNPRDAGPHPMVLLIHGGGWRAGERAHVHEMAMMLADAGFVSVAVDYRKTERPGYRFPGAIADLRCAVRFLRQNAQALDANPTQIGAVGFSAGGHLAALLATAAEVDALDDGCPHSGSARIQAAVSYYGVHDLTRRGDFVPRARRLISQMLGGTGVDRARLASPQNHVDAEDPPILLIHGTSDRVVPIVQSERMAATLRRAGVLHRLIRVPEGSHGFTLRTDTPSVQPATCTAISFLRSSLRENVPTVSASSLN